MWFLYLLILDIFSFFFNLRGHFVFNRIVALLFHLLFERFLKRPAVIQRDIRCILTIISFTAGQWDCNFGFLEPKLECSETDHSLFFMSFLSLCGENCHWGICKVLCLRLTKSLREFTIYLGIYIHKSSSS